jgi:ubiquinone/menaquinone biosynthesis C-methylase UbiE
MKPRTLLFVSFLFATTLPAQETKQAPPDKKPRYETKKDHDPDGIGKFYLGREIAYVMGHQGASWLDRPEREKEEAPSKLLPALKIKQGDAVADIGAGSGYYTLMAAKHVGPKGKVYAVDIQPEMLDIIKKKMTKRGVKNIELIKNTETETKLAAASVDLILLVDVYHEFTYPYEMTVDMVKALKPKGRMVFVEFRLEDTNVPIKNVHRMSEKQVLKEMAEHPELRHVGTLDFMPWQHVIIFERKIDEKK